MYLSANFGASTAKYAPLYSERCRLAYVRHDFNRVGFPQITYFPDVIQYQNTGYGTAKGDTVAIERNWWLYSEKINTPDAYDYTRSIDLMLINRPYDNQTPYSTGMQEPILCGGNFIQIIDETPTHYRVMGYPNGQDTSKLDPEIDNWFCKPHRFFKACAVERNGTKVINVGKGGLDVYWMIIEPKPKATRPAEIWVQKSKVDYLGEQDWQFHRGEVYLQGKLYHPTGAVKP